MNINNFAFDGTAPQKTLTTFCQAHNLVYTEKCRTTTNLFGKRAKLANTPFSIQFFKLSYYVMSSTILPCGLCEFAMDLFVCVDVESPLDEGEGHLQGFHSELRAVLSNELKPLNSH